MGVYGLVWTQLGYWYRYRGTFLVLNGTFSVLFRYLMVLDAFLSLNPIQYGCLWTRLDPTRSPVPVLRYLTVLNSNCSVHLAWSA